jgi:hypothetical protein
METDRKTSEYSTQSREPRTKLRFTCPRCGGRDLRIMLLCAFYPTSTLDFLEVDPDGPDDFELHERDPYGEHCSSMNEGWEFECAGCGATPTVERDGEQVPVEDEEELAEWLLKHCPQEDGEVSVTKDEPQTGT